MSERTEPEELGAAAELEGMLSAPPLDAARLFDKPCNSRFAASISLTDGGEVAVGAVGGAAVVPCALKSPAVHVRVKAGCEESAATEVENGANAANERNISPQNKVDFA